MYLVRNGNKDSGSGKTRIFTFLSSETVACFSFSMKPWDFFSVFYCMKVIMLSLVAVRLFVLEL